MYLVWLAVLLVGLKLTGIGVIAELSWWWVLAPLGVAFVWFEWIEKLLGFDKRRADHLEWEQRRKERVAAQFPVGPGAKRRT
ncbi:MAG: TIGR04438 family Trp-rich protein [Burkholderiaceae bacterium]|nr:TIGR04438 family Trp-rich protein [Burkholderiaceae bacterium]